MTNINLFIQLGIWGETKPNGSVPLNDNTIGNTSDWAGSFHIFSMERHHSSYISRRLPQFHPREELPPLDNFISLTRKNPSQQVIGNFGESIGAIFARNILNTPIKRIVPLATNRAIKRPDYMMRLDGSEIRDIFNKVIPPHEKFPYLDDLNWWPVEAKAVASEKSMFGQKRRALIQLLSFWKNERENLHSSIGYGMILTYVYHDPRKLIANIILPKDPSRLYEELQVDPSDKELYQIGCRVLYGHDI